MHNPISDKASQLNENGYFFNRNYYFHKAVALIAPNWLVLSSFTGLYILFLLVLFRFPQVGQIVQLIISGPISAGYYLVINRLRKGQSIQFNDFFDGFRYAFVPSLMVSLLTGIIITIGFALFVVPGILFSIIYLFAMPLVIFSPLNYWSALESSRVIISKKFTEALLFGLTIFAINILGLLTLGIGVLFTIPLSYAMILMAFDDIYGIDAEDAEPPINDFSHFR